MIIKKVMKIPKILKPIPVYKPNMGGNEIKYVNDCLKSNWISSRGSYINRFESNFAQFLNLPAATSVTNGTVALHLSLYALGIGPGDEVIVPTLTYIATVNAIAYVGAKPVFVDSLDDTWNLDPQDVKQKITKRTKAIIVVHLFGNPCDISECKNICEKNNIFLIEDSAEAFGSLYNGKFLGGFGDFSTFSFFGNKTITTGEGGMVTSNRIDLVKRVAFLKNQGVSSTKEYWHDEVGFNYRMTNICAAIGLAQLERAKQILKKKRSIMNWYSMYLQGTDIKFQHVDYRSTSSYWMVAVLALTKAKRDGLRDYLKSNAIETRPMFCPVHKMPAFYSTNPFPVAERLSRRGLYLPSYPDLSKKDVEIICNLIRGYLN